MRLTGSPATTFLGCATKVPAEDVAGWAAVGAGVDADEREVEFPVGEEERVRVEAVAHGDAGLQVCVDFGGEFGDDLFCGLGGGEYVVVGEEEFGGDEESGAVGEFPAVVEQDEPGD